MPRITHALLVLVAALAVAACTAQEPEITAQQQVPAAARTEAPAEGGEGGEGGAPAEADAETTWVAVDVDFAEAETELPAGTVAVTLENEGNLPHDITIEELGDETVVAVEGGETATSTVELQPGTYTFYCSVPGHRSTMEETVEVAESA